MKLTRSIQLRKTTKSVVAKAFLDNCVYVYGATRYVITDNGLQFAGNLFDAVGVRHYQTTAYQPPANGQTERFNQTLVRRLRHYVEEHQRNWDEYIQPRTSCMTCRSTGRRRLHRSTWCSLDHRLVLHCQVLYRRTQSPTRETRGPRYSTNARRFVSSAVPLNAGG